MICSTTRTLCLLMLLLARSAPLWGARSRTPKVTPLDANENDLGMRALAKILLAYNARTAWSPVLAQMRMRGGARVLPGRMSAPESKVKSLPYGSWPSPITASFITSSSVGLGSLKVDNQGNLFWLEGRPQEQGRYVVVQYNRSAPTANERGGVDMTPKDVNVRTRVHEYGGGAYTLHPSGGVIYSDFVSQRLFWSKGEMMAPMPLTPETGPSGWPSGRYRFADGQVDPSGNRLIAIREDHGEQGTRAPSEVVNEIVSIALDGSGEMTVLASGKDFYAAPRVSPSGDKLAYVSWNHPSMPWDATELRVVNLANGCPSTSDTLSHELIDGGDSDTSVLQPAWHPTTGALYYIADSSGFYNLLRVPGGPIMLESGVAILPRSTDFGGAAPGWSFGQQGYAFLHDGRIAATFSEKTSGKTQLIVFNDPEATHGGDIHVNEVVYGSGDGLPPMIGGLAPSSDGTLYFLGGGPDTPASIYAWRGLAAEKASGMPAEVLACSSSSRVPEGYVSIPKLVEFPSKLGNSFGYYYPPTNPTAQTDEKSPPLLVKAHGGPTACTSCGFNPTIQFYTSRGFAVLDVDYGGSTGYGRAYRRRLRRNWGVVDIDDVCAGASYLVEKGLADPKRLAIDGGSAGGYTTLGALAFRNIFTAGCSLYGVSDCSALAQDTHKFESRYLDGLIGEYPREKALYDERAPINSVEKLSCPILLLQGDEDKIVPPDQAEKMHAALLEKGIPTALKIYKGEQHGFRKAENIEDALNSELYFYSKVFGFDLAGDDIKPFPIDNLSE